MSHSHIITQHERDNEGHVQSVPVLILLPSLILFNLAIASVTTVILMLMSAMELPSLENVTQVLEAVCLLALHSVHVDLCL